MTHEQLLDLTKRMDASEAQRARQHKAVCERLDRIATLLEQVVSSNLSTRSQRFERTDSIGPQ